MGKKFMVFVLLMLCFTLLSSAHANPVLTYWNTTPKSPTVIDSLTFNMTCITDNASALIIGEVNVSINGIYNNTLGGGVLPNDTNSILTTMFLYGFSVGDNVSINYWCYDYYSNESSSDDWSNVTIVPRNETCCCADAINGLTASISGIFVTSIFVLFALLALYLSSILVESLKHPLRAVCWICLLTSIIFGIANGIINADYVNGIQYVFYALIMFEMILFVVDVIWIFGKRKREKDSEKY